MMLTIITVCTFACLALSFLFLARLLMRPAAATAGPPGTVPAFGPWTNGLAGQIPHRRAYLDAISLQLSQAGHYGPHARRNFLATRNILVVGIVLLAAGLIVVEGAENPIAGWSIAGGGALLAALAYAIPGLILSAQARRRVERIERGLPDALDILTMCLGGGLPLRRSLQYLAEEIENPHPDLACELRIVMRQAELGSLPQAFDQFARRIGSADVRSLAVLVGDAQRLGADVRGAAREQADGIRRSLRFQAEERAGRAGAQLILPFVFCLLPGMAILLWAPALLELRETIDRETRPGGAFSQDVPGAIEQLSRELGLPDRSGSQATSLPFYRDFAPGRSASTSRTGLDYQSNRQRSNRTNQTQSFTDTIQADARSTNR